MKEVWGNNFFFLSTPIQTLGTLEFLISILKWPLLSWHIIANTDIVLLRQVQYLSVYWRFCKAVSLAYG